MRNVKISAVGGVCYGEPQADITRRIEEVLPDQPDLIILPELCDRPSGMTSKAWYGQQTFWGAPDYIREIARNNHCYIAFPTLTKPDGHYRNAIVMVDREGNVMGEYHKVNPTIGEMEDTGILAGRHPAVFDCDFGRVGCAICFDLCFQELAWQYRELKPDLMIFCSMYHGGFVQQVWAYNTLSHFAFATPSPVTPSGIMNPVGELLAHTTNYQSHITAIVNLDCCATFLGLNAGKLKAAKKKYGSRIQISDPGYVGAVLLTSETDEFTAEDVFREFEIEPVRTYFDRVRAVRQNHLEPVPEQEEK